MLDFQLLSKRIGLEIAHFDTIDSTNLYCKRLLSENKELPDLVIARAQTNGQGRLGKSFYSPEGSGLYLTFIYSSSALQVNDLTPRVALAVARGIDSVFNTSCLVKWVNDIYWNDRKIAGILCQNDSGHYLIGIGINIQKPISVPEEIKERFGYLVDSCDNSVYGDVIECLSRELSYVFQEDDSNVLDEYRKRCNHIGKTVSILVDDRPFVGTCVGIADDFSLAVEKDGVVKFFTSGFMSI